MSKVNLSSEILSQKDVKLLVQSINNSRQQYEHWNEERDIRYHNGKYLDRWNYIFDNIENAFNYKPFKTYHVSRGRFWEFAIIYNTETQILYLVFKEETFYKIKGDKNNQYHYARVLNTKNFELQPQPYQKINMFSGVEDISNEYIDEDLERMISEIKNEVKGCVNILFKENREGVYKLTANLANYNLDIFNTYDLSEYITAGIEEIIDTKIDVVSSSPKIPLNIRKDKIKSKSEEIIEDKTKKDSKENNKK